MLTVRNVDTDADTYEKLVHAHVIRNLVLTRSF